MSIGGGFVKRLGAVLVVFVWTVPMLWILETAFKPDRALFQANPFGGFSPTIAQFRKLFADGQFTTGLVNSLVICSAATAIAMLIASLAAYALAYFRLPLERTIALTLFAFKLVPAVVLAIPFFVLFGKLGLADTRTGLVAVYVVFTVPLAVWLLRTFFVELPREMIEAALVDGYGPARLLFRVVLPVAAPGVAVTAIFSFIFLWNDFIFAFFLTQQKAFTVPVYITDLVLQYQVLWGQMAAAAIVAVLPLAGIVFALQRHILRGMTFGAVR